MVHYIGALAASVISQQRLGIKRKGKCWCMLIAERFLLLKLTIDAEGQSGKIFRK